MKSAVILIACLAFVYSVPVQQESQKDLVDIALNALGLGQVIDTIQQLGTQYWNQLKQIATQLLFAGSQVWQQAQAIFGQLVSDLQNHASDALPLVLQAIDFNTIEDFDSVENFYAEDELADDDDDDQIEKFNNSNEFSKNLPMLFKISLFLKRPGTS
ncbi:unnamed protein product [Brachionus calyciflorus]|uniref:Uncharacterized protein n=1 Tax=Brachionus calyciflorus TaxID=104777 RepID=A0A814LYZ0_9BILA|nr:unnamed protein product [Brachionus calyciflorus]